MNRTSPENTSNQNYYSVIQEDMVAVKVENEFIEIVKKDIGFENKLDISYKTAASKKDFITIRKSWILNIVFDNDIFDNTDYYYTNGCKIELVTPFADNSPLNKILPSSGKTSINFSGFSVQQNIYTPINPDVVEIQYNDRPFSAFLTVGQFRESVNFQKKINLKSEISFGIVGPASLGQNVQSSIHDIEPVGWQNQVKNDIVLNYSILFEKGLISKRNIEINATANGNFGTLFDNAGIGFYLRTGSFLPVYRGPLSAISDKKSTSPFQYWFFATANINAILYDATLQGGLINGQNPYTISKNEISRLIYGGSAGVAVSYGQFGLELENFYLSPEFDGARHFMYGRIKISATF